MWHTFFETMMPLSFIIFLVFIFNSIFPAGIGWAQLSRQSILDLPAPGRLFLLSPGFKPPIIKGLTIYPNNPLEFDFIVDTGESGMTIESLQFRDESRKLIKYFLAALTVPDDQLWVNLSPFEKDRMIPQQLGQTEMGRDMLVQDYILKQLTASLTYPENELGKGFWKKVYAQIRQVYGAEVSIPINTFNKVWIVPDKAVIYEIDRTAFLVQSHLKVMLEEDYLALEKTKDNRPQTKDLKEKSQINALGSQIVREILIPALTKEVNEGKNFANVRQICQSMILATWYKKNLKESLLGRVYVDKNKIKGVEVEDKKIKEKIYQQYLQAFKKGVYNYIKEDLDPVTQKPMPRKYFSGGVLYNADVVSVGAKAQALAGLNDRQREIFDAAIRTEGEDGRINVVLAEVGPKADTTAIQQIVTQETNNTTRQALDYAQTTNNYTREGMFVLKRIMALVHYLRTYPDHPLSSRLQYQPAKDGHRDRIILDSKSIFSLGRIGSPLSWLDPNVIIKFSKRSNTLTIIIDGQKYSVTEDGIPTLLDNAMASRPTTTRQGSFVFTTLSNLVEYLRLHSTHPLSSKLERQGDKDYGGRIRLNSKIIFSSVNVANRTNGNSPYDPTVIKEIHHIQGKLIITIDGQTYSVARDGTPTLLDNAMVSEGEHAVRRGTLTSTRRGNFLFSTLHALVQYLQSHPTHPLSSKELKSESNDGYKTGRVRLGPEIIFSSVNSGNFLGGSPYDPAVIKKINYNKKREVIITIDRETYSIAENGTPTLLDTDEAMSAEVLIADQEGPRQQATNVGGIDLNPKLLDMQIKRDGKGVPLPISQQPIPTMHIEGFLPIIINITAVNIPLLLGSAERKNP